MIEVLNINPIQKGNLLATCDVHIKPWKLTMIEVKIFEKGANRWINLPSKEFTTETGEKKYTEMLVFDTEVIKNRFRAQILKAVDEYLAGNPEMKFEDVIKQEEELPF